MKREIRLWLSGPILGALILSGIVGCSSKSKQLEQAHMNRAMLAVEKAEIATLPEETDQNIDESSSDSEENIDGGADTDKDGNE